MHSNTTVCASWTSVSVKLVVTDVMYPVLTEQGFKIEFGQQARFVGVNSRSDAVSVELRRRPGTGWIRGVVFAVLTSKSASEHVIKAMVASVSNWSGTDIILKSDGDPSC